MAQQQLQKRWTNPLSHWPQSLWNFPISRFPSLWEDWEEWGALPQMLQEQNISMSEDDKNIFVEAALPGLDLKDIDVSMDKGILRIQGERKEEEETKDKKIHSRAISSYSYRIALPQQIDEKSEPKAIYKDGILKLTLVKASATQTKKITVKGG